MIADDPSEVALVENVDGRCVRKRPFEVGWFDSFAGELNGIVNIVVSLFANSPPCTITSSPVVRLYPPFGYSPSDAESNTTKRY